MDGWLVKSFINYEIDTRIVFLLGIRIFEFVEFIGVF